MDNVNASVTELVRVGASELSVALSGSGLLPTATFVACCCCSCGGGGGDDD